MRAREKQINEMIAATMKLTESAAELDLSLLSSLYRMCVLELTNLADEEMPPKQARARLGASLN